MPERVCPVWVGYLLASPLRRLLHDPEKILAPYVKQGMTVLDIGSAMGFFSIPLAKMVGPKGKVICVDMQEKMLQRLQKRAEKAGVADRIETRLCDQNSLRLHDRKGTADLAAFFVVHEVPDHPRLFDEIAAALKPNALLLVAEPKGHVKEEDFNRSVVETEQHGFKVVARPEIRRSRVVALERV
jgi:ubiquinone/menaquinone biosynthesis C-methylase UbiE